MSKNAFKPVCVAALAALAAACGQDIAYHPAPQLLPAHIKKVAIRPIANKTQQFGMEDKLMIAVRDQFLKDGNYLIVPEDDSDGIVAISVERYVLTPIAFDSTLVPTQFKLRIMIDLQFIDRASNQILWEERNMEGIQTYAAMTLPGGITEEQAREAIWASLANDIVTRVVQGFGTVTGESARRISSDAPSTAPPAQPEKPLAPVVPNPY